MLVMSLFYAVRRAASSVAPVVFGTLKKQRLFHSALVSAFQNCCKKEIIEGTPWVSRRAATSIAVSLKSNENLVELLEDQIQREIESDPPTEDAKPSGAIPWEIEDILGNQAVILRKKYGNEDIKIEVMPGDMGNDDDEDPEEEDSDGKIVPVESHVYLTVTISKGEGPFLEFICTGYANEVSIDAMTFKHPQEKISDEEDRIPYDGPDFNDLDENLQKAFRKYVEVRGIKPTLTSYLSELMVHKGSKENINWLKTVKEYIEK